MILFVRINKTLNELIDDKLSIVERYERYIDLNLTILSPKTLYPRLSKSIKVQVSNVLRRSVHFYLSASLARTQISAASGFSNGSSEELRWLARSLSALPENRTFLSRTAINRRLHEFDDIRSDYARVIDLALRTQFKTRDTRQKRGIRAINEIASDHNALLGITVKQRYIEEYGSTYRHIGVFWHEMEFESEQRLLGIERIGMDGQTRTLAYLNDMDAIRRDIGRILAKIAALNGKFVDQIPLGEIPGVAPPAYHPEPLPQAIRDAIDGW